MKPAFAARSKPLQFCATIREKNNSHALSKGKKLDKRFLITDETVNSYGFRLLTSGYLRSEFERNPIGYFMHARPEGVLLRWEEFETEGDKVYAKPVINMSHPRAQQTIDEIENGFLNAASVGHLVILEYTDDPALMLPNQKGPTVTKWFNRELSLVDIPGNFNALKLYDKDDNEINLADFTKSTIPQMKKLELTADQLAKLNLKAESTEAELNVALTDLIERAGKVGKLETELSDLRKSVSKDRVKRLLADALAANKITKEIADVYEVDYAEKPDALDKLLKATPEYKGLAQRIGESSTLNEKRVQDLVAKGFDALMESGEIIELKGKAPDAYKALYKETFGKEPNA